MQPITAPRDQIRKKRLCCSISARADLKVWLLLARDPRTMDASSPPASAEIRGKTGHAAARLLRHREIRLSVLDGDRGETVHVSASRGAEVIQRRNIYH
jgi:hypothetical protein